MQLQIEFREAALTLAGPQSSLVWSGLAHFRQSSSVCQLDYIMTELPIDCVLELSGVWSVGLSFHTDV